MRRPILWILIAAVALRLLYTFGWVRGLQGISPQDEITDGYEQIAENLFQGLGYRQFASHPPTLQRPPGYPLFLLAVRSIGDSDFVAVQVAQALLGGLSAGLLYLLGRWLLGERVGLWAAFLGAIHPASVQYSAQLYAENLYIPLFLAFAWLLCRAVSRASRRDGLFSGLFFAAGLLTRGTLLLFPIALFAGLPLHPRLRSGARRWWRWAVPAACSACLLVSPWVARNYRLTGAFVPSSAWGWAPFYHGIRCSQSMLSWGDLAQADRLAESDRQRRVVETLYGNDPSRAYDSPRDFLRHEAVARELVHEEIRRDPLGFALRGVAGIPFAWFQTLSPRKRILSLALHLPLMILFIVGTIRMLRFSPAAAARAWPALCLIAFVNGFSAWVFPLARYMAPAVALSFVFSAFACAAPRSEARTCV